jgi:hypothetical protein
VLASGGQGVQLLLLLKLLEKVPFWQRLALAVALSI